MAYEDLKQEMEVCSEEEINAILDSARKRAEEILREAQTQAEGTKQHYLHEAIRIIKIERMKLLYRVKSEVKNRENAEKNAIYQQAFHSAREKLNESRMGNAYEESFRKMLTRAVNEIHSPSVRIHIDEQDEQLCREIVKELDIQAEIISDLDSIGGCRVSLPDETVIVHNTIESRLEKAKDFLKKDVFSALYGD
jgi:vacuolar-type H+-ATPase subunit E/Vma4